MLSFDLKNTWAVLIGSSKFPRDTKEWHSLPAVKNNVQKLAEILADSKKRF